MLNFSCYCGIIAVQGEKGKDRSESLKLRDITIKDVPRDIFTGIIIALVSIPISMGYAQVSGLPAVCGLYGSIFTVLIF